LRGKSASWPSLEVNSRALTGEAVEPNADKVLRPGFFAAAELIIPGQKERFVIPESALVRKGDVNRVYVVRDGTVTEKVLDVDEVRDSRAYVKSGLVATTRSSTNRTRSQDTRRRPMAQVAEIWCGVPFSLRPGACFVILGVSLFRLGEESFSQGRHPGPQCRSRSTGRRLLKK
jgi:hypothetical protein